VGFQPTHLLRLSVFSAYFVPEAPGGADPFPLFMDPSRSSEVIWKPRPDTPRRYLDFAQGVCGDCRCGTVQKVTKLNDPMAIPYTRRRKDGGAPGGRMVGTTSTALQLQDGERLEEIPFVRNGVSRGRTRCRHATCFGFRPGGRSFRKEFPCSTRSVPIAPCRSFPTTRRWWMRWRLSRW